MTPVKGRDPIWGSPTLAELAANAPHPDERPDPEEPAEPSGRSAAPRRGLLRRAAKRAVVRTSRGDEGGS